MERRWLVELLRDKKAVGLLLKYLKATGVRKKERAKDKEVEWERRNDQVSEDLFE